MSTFSDIKIRAGAGVPGRKFGWRGKLGFVHDGCWPDFPRREGGDGVGIRRRGPRERS